MPRRIDHVADCRQRQGQTRRRLVVHHADRLDGVRRVLLQDRGNLGNIDAAPPVGMHRARLQAVLGGHHAPFFREIPGLDDQHLVAGGEQVDQRRLPGAVAGCGIHEQMLAGAQHALHPGIAGIEHRGEIRVHEVDRDVVDRPQDAVGDVRRAGIGEKLPAAGLRKGHRALVPWCWEHWQCARRARLSQPRTASHQRGAASRRPGCPLITGRPPPSFAA
jgi:hypothetical protein